MSLEGRLYDAMHDALISMEISQAGETKDGPLVEVEYLTALEACEVATQVALRFISFQKQHDQMIVDRLAALEEIKKERNDRT